MQKFNLRNQALRKITNTPHGEQLHSQPKFTAPAENLDPKGSTTWLSTEEVAARLKIPKKTLAVWASANQGPRYAKIGRFRRYRLCDLIEWEQDRLTRGGGWNSPDKDPHS